MSSVAGAGGDHCVASPRRRYRGQPRQTPSFRGRVEASIAIESIDSSMPFAETCPEIMLDGKDSQLHPCDLNQDFLLVPGVLHVHYR